MSVEQWRPATLADLVSLQRGHDLPEAERRPGTVPVMGSAGPNGYHSEWKAKGPGVTIGRCGVGSMGVVSFSPTDYWPHNTVLYATDFHRNDPKFVYYHLTTINFRAFNSGSAQASLNRNYIKNIPIVLPPLPEQRRIVEVLSALDDKIELNRKMSQTLEQIAQALFKAWFVDFEGQQDLVEVEGRMVPRGWRYGKLGEATEITMGQSPPGSTYNETGDGLPFFQGATDFGAMFPRNRIYCTAPTRLAVKWDVLMSVRAPVGRANLALTNCAIGRGVASIRSVGGKSPAFGWCLVASLAAALDVYNGEGTIFGSINRQSLAGIPVVLPPQGCIEAFELVAGPMLKRARNIEEESRTLTTLRDTLLPKLISGEVRVGELP